MRIAIELMVEIPSTKGRSSNKKGVPFPGSEIEKTQQCVLDIWSNSQHHDSEGLFYFNKTRAPEDIFELVKLQ